MSAIINCFPRPPVPTSEEYRRYREYLKSPAWKCKRDAVFQRENGICQGCLEEPIEHVHHLTYWHLFDELLFELIGMCESCHRKSHWLNPLDPGVEIEY